MSQRLKAQSKMAKQKWAIRIAIVTMLLVFWQTLSLQLPAFSHDPRRIELPAICSVKLQDPKITWQLPTDVEGELTQDNFNVVQRAADLFAWQEFIALNWPAKEGDRGQPDQTATLAQLGPRVWETWKETSEVYRPDGLQPDPWNSLPRQSRLSSQAGLKKVLFRSSKVDEILNDQFQPTKADGTLPGTLTDQRGNVVRYEIRMNKVLFDYVVANKLYQSEKQSSFPEISAPVGSILVKAAWREVSPEEQGRFYTALADVQNLEGDRYQEKLMGLVGFHVMTKTASAPQWIWSTYEQIDNVEGLHPSFFNPDCPSCLQNQQTQPQVPNQITRETPIPAVDPDCSQKSAAVDNIVALNQVIQKGLGDSVWRHYQLINTQWPVPSRQPSSPSTVFTVLPTVLANTTMESYIQKSSSCMGCHAIARSSNAQQYRSADFSFTFADARPVLKNTQIIPPPRSPKTNWARDNWNSILRGYQIANKTYETLPQYVPQAKLHCASCHLSVGADPKASSWFGMIKKYQYPETDDLQKRINSCFEHSLNGLPLPLERDNPESQALITYMQWLDQEAERFKITLPKTAYPNIQKLNGDSKLGQAIFEQKCAFCHGLNGEGRYGSNTYYRPALWGNQSFNRLAGLAQTETLAKFLKSNMPYQFGGNLTDQEAWDLASFIDRQPRPQGPYQKP
ncbi:c-type cytochrome [Synechococcus elongatus]|uniref:c-type cytochrome n=1 Tax=Synechococcus elongatus TaxID=32046 RepID=UPI0021C2A0F6|nr:c-type cytochrome [Synechococcus elongatus]